jgi:hypothetical protein
MSIVITIEGNHPTDVLAQLKTLSEGLSGQQSAPVAVSYDQGSKDETVISKVQVSEGKITEVEEVIPQPRKLVGKEHKIEADKMIQAGEIDNDIFPLLSKKQQERVEDEIIIKEEPKDLGEVGENDLVATEVTIIDGKVSLKDIVISKEIQEPAPVEDKQEDVTGLFDDEPAEPVEPEKVSVTKEDIGKLIVSKCKDSNGKDIPEMYAAVRAELKNVVGKEEEPKISNIPVSKYADLYNAINKL